MNGSNAVPPSNSSNFFKKIEVKPRNVLIKPDSAIKERFFEIDKISLRDKKNTSIKLLSNSSASHSNSRPQSNSFIRPANQLRANLNPLK